MPFALTPFLPLNDALRDATPKANSWQSFRSALLPHPAHAAESPKEADGVNAGYDRVVVLGGKTYLTGERQGSLDAKDDPSVVTWSKVSGPGEVTFANVGPPPKKAWYNGHQAMEMALVRLGRLVNQTEGKGKGDTYIALGKFLLDARKGGSEYDQSHVPAVQQCRAVGHAVRASYSYAGMAGVAMERRPSA